MSERTEETAEAAEETSGETPDNAANGQGVPRDDVEAHEAQAGEEAVEDSPGGNGTQARPDIGAKDCKADGDGGADAAEADLDETLVGKASKILKDRLGLSAGDAQDGADEEPELSHEELREAHREATQQIEKLTEQRDRYAHNLARSYDQIKRLERRIKETRKYGAESLARDILGTYDNFDRALAAGRSNRDMDLKSWLEGVEGVARDFSRTLSRNGLTEISPEEGEKFDPAWHEALYSVPAPDLEPGTVLRVEQIGFRLHDRLLRPAKVGVVARIDDMFEDDSDDAE